MSDTTAKEYDNEFGTTPLGDGSSEEGFAKAASLNDIGTSGVVENQNDTGSAPAKARKPKLVQQKRRLTSADIRKVRDIKTEEVWVEQWGGLALIKALSAKERDDFEDSVLQRRGGKKSEREFTNKNIRAKLVVRCLINPDFSRMYTDADAEWLGDKNASAINTLYEHCAILSGITQADEDELEKNSLNGDGAASE